MDDPSPLVCFTTTRTGRYAGRVRDLPKHHALHELMRLLDGANTRADSALWITTRGGPWRAWSRLPATRRATSSAGHTGNPVPAAATLSRTVFRDPTTHALPLINDSAWQNCCPRSFVGCTLTPTQPSSSPAFRRHRIPDRVGTKLRRTRSCNDALAGPKAGGS
jgi:hypothetical protein